MNTVLASPIINTRKEAIMNGKLDNQADPTALCFEEYRDCFGEPGELMKKHLLCGLCGGHLHFNHMSDFRNNLIQETARCPDCGIRVRNRLHKLQ